MRVFDFIAYVYIISWKVHTFQFKADLTNQPLDNYNNAIQNTHYFLKYISPFYENEVNVLRVDGLAPRIVGSPAAMVSVTQN